MKNRRSFKNAKRLLLTLGVLIVISYVARADANQVYHEQTFHDVGCGSQKFMNTKTPVAGSQVTIAWRIQYQFFTNNSVVYYTTDGSTPSGSFGIGNGTTQVISGAYVCSYGSPKIDVVRTSIPGQSFGTTVKYIIGAWNSGGGDEIFANGVGSSCNCGNPSNNASLATIFSYDVDHLIDPNGDGGFELGNTFASNGWTVVNSSANLNSNWYLTSMPLSKANYTFTPTGNRAAFISKNGTTWEYVGNAGFTSVHLYKDLTFPIGKNNLQLSFRLSGNGNRNDHLNVYICPTSNTPALNKPQLDGYEVGSDWKSAGGAHDVYFLGSFRGSGKIISINIPDSVAGNCFSNSTRRIVFTWHNSGVSQLFNDPPIAVDDISLRAFADPSTLSSSGGSYTIDNTLPNGPSNFSSFTSAINSLNSVVSCGPLTASIIFNVTAEQEFVEDPPAITQGGNANARVIFQRSGTGPNPVIKPIGVAADNAGIALKGVSYVTFDGIDIKILSGDQLAYGYLVSPRTDRQGCYFNIIQNTHIQLNRNNTGSCGIFQTWSYTASSGLLDNGSSISGNKYLNLDIQNANSGIMLIGGSASNPDNNNEIGTLPGGETKIGADYTGVPFGDLGGSGGQSTGIYASTQSNLKVSNCKIQNIVGNNGRSASGIIIERCLGSTEISGNTIRGLAAPCNGCFSPATGISVEAGTDSEGIDLPGTVLIYNNFVSDVANYGFRVGYSKPVSDINIDFNSVSIDNKNAGNPGSACVLIDNIELSQNNIRNNILANYTQDQSGSSYHSIIQVNNNNSAMGNASSICDNNDYHIENPVNGVIGLVNNIPKPDIASWASAMTGNPTIDANTLTVDPLFNNIHTDLTANAFAINNAANPTGISWVTTSIDGSPRPATPDIGAREFVPPPLDIAIKELTAPTNIQCYTNPQTVIATVKNFSYLTLDLSLNPVTIIVTVSGATNYTSSTTINTGTIAPEAELNVTLPDLINMDAAGVYQFTIELTLAGDVNPENNISDVIERKVSELKPLPQFVNLTNYNGTNLQTVFPGWFEASIQNSKVIPGDQSNIYSMSLFPQQTATAGFRIFSSNTTYMMLSPKFLATPATLLEFKMAMNNFFSVSAANNGGMLGTDDQFAIKISTDCGNSFQSLFVFNSSNIGAITNSLTQQSFDLGSYAGQECIIMLSAFSGTVNESKSYAIHIDDIFIGEPVICSLTPEAGIISALTTAVCDGGSTSISATGFSVAEGITHQWQSSTNGTDFSDVGGATITSLNTGSIVATRYFRMVATCQNSGLSHNSNIVAINVNPAPTGNTFTDPIIISSLPYTIAGNNLISNCWTSTYTGLHANASPDVFYKFTATCSGQLKISLCGGGTLEEDALHLLNGSGTEIAYNESGGPLCTGFFASIQYNLMIAGQTYYIVVEGRANIQGTYSLSVTQTVAGLNTFYADFDDDGYGNPNSTLIACVEPGGYVINSDDCNDGDADIHLNAIEICNGIDDDCNGLVDDNIPNFTWYRDNDSDGYGVPAGSVQSCSQPSGYTNVSGDCNDNDAAVNPGTIEVCNGIDDDCDGHVDETGTTFYRDADGDGYGNAGVSAQACTAPAGYVSNATDCNDNNASVNPAAVEVCSNNIDDNCNGLKDEQACYVCKNATSFSTTNITTNSATLNWTSVPNPVQWQVQYKTTSPGSKWKDVILAGNRRSVTISGLLANQNYNWHIRAQCGKNWTDYSKSVSFKTSKSQGVITQSRGAGNLPDKSLAPETTGLQLKALPNPSYHNFNITVSGNNRDEKIALKVIDMYGRLIEQRQNLNHGQTIQIGNKYTAGMYLVEIKQGSQWRYTKLIKQ